MNDLPQPADERVITDVETIKVLADARRMAMLRLMQRPSTVKAIAQQLEIAPSKLYYHVNLLVEHDLLRVVDHNIESGIVEKVYQVTARRFLLQNPLLAGETMPRDTAEALLVSMLNEASAAFRRSFAAGLQDDRQPPRFPFVTYRPVRLSDEQLTELHARLTALVRDITQIDARQNAPDAVAYEFALAFFQSPDDNPDHSQEGSDHDQ